MSYSARPATGPQPLSRAEWERTPETERVTLGARRFVWRRSLPSLPSARAEEGELVEVQLAEEAEQEPLVHMVCTSCRTEVWWPAEVRGAHLCFQCGGVLELEPVVPAEHGSTAPAADAAPTSPSIVELLRASAETERRNAQTAALSPDRPGAAADFRLRLSRAHRLESLAVALNGLGVDGVEALTALVEGADPAHERVLPTDEVDRRLLVSRARVAVATLRGLLVAVHDHT